MTLESHRPSLKSRNLWRPGLLSSGVAMFLFAAAVKPGLSSEFDTVTYSGLVAILRDYSQYIGAIGLLLLLYVWILQPRLVSFKFTYPATWLLIFKITIALRLITTPVYGLEQLVSFTSILILYFIILSRDGKSKSEIHYKSIFIGMYHFTITILLLNFYLYLFEYSTTSWKGRFVGVFHHPNFAGVNFAICASIIFGLKNTQNKAKVNTTFNAISLSLIVLSAFLIMASGSRTGILGYIAALLGYFYIQKHLKASTLIFLAFISFIVILSLDSIIELLAYYIPGFERITQAGNTRDVVWTLMWEDFIANPIFGSGASVTATAGSYLRVLAIAGLIAALPLLICITLCIARAFRNRGNFAFRSAWLPGLMCILITSITEGHLADSLSLALIYFVITVFALSLRRPVYL